ncbi:MAG: hypothetical protein CL677_00355 [Bdellovibrionaceae bacterium]|jgi:hypothetical protein|nr:hypothetical protein [Pseudobdellovibrionaceae bacterium]
MYFLDLYAQALHAVVRANDPERVGKIIELFLMEGSEGREELAHVCRYLLQRCNRSTNNAGGYLDKLKNIDR